MSSIQGMNHSVTNNRNLKGERKTLYDQEAVSSGIYGEMHDHKKMYRYEFALFKEEQSKKRKIEYRRQLKLRILTLVISLVIVISFLLIWNHLDFERLSAPYFR